MNKTKASSSPDCIETFNASAALAEMSPEFKEKVTNGYKSEPKWRRIMDTIKQNDSLSSEDRALLPFVAADNIIWRREEATGDYAF